MRVKDDSIMIGRARYLLFGCFTADAGGGKCELHQDLEARAPLNADFVKILNVLNPFPNKPC